MNKVIWSLSALLACAAPAGAQTVIQPTSFQFVATDADVAKTLSYRLEFYQCTGVTNGAGTGCAAAPFQTGVDIPKSLIASAGTTRTASLTAAPAAGLLAAVPSGVPFVATVSANADANQGATNSARSAVSNPFYGAAAALAAPSTLKLLP